MKIIRKGSIPVRTKEFTCDYCGTIFEATDKEYEYHDGYDWYHDIAHWSNTCKCPICNREVSIFGENR